MQRFTVPALLLILAIAPSAMADGEPPWDFEYTAPGGAILDYNVQWFPLEVPDALEIVYMELEIGGVTHNAPGDLWVYLLDPFGGGVTLMDDTGDQLPIVGINLVFSDKGDPLPGNGQLLDPIDPGLSDRGYAPMGPGTFGQYAFTTYGTMYPGTWRLVMTDDSRGEAGSFESFTLRGVVPEPMTLSLLALGAVAALRRKWS